VEGLNLILTGGSLDFQHGIQILMDSRRLKLSASITRTGKTCTILKRDVPALFADESSVDTGRHGPELNTKHAIGTAGNFLAHKKTWPDGEAKDKDQSSPCHRCLSRPWDKFISEWVPS